VTGKAAEQEKAGPKTWVIAVAVSVSVVGLMAVVGYLVFWR
jgi:hypothetical protein